MVKIKNFFVSIFALMGSFLLFLIILFVIFFSRNIKTKRNGYISLNPIKNDANFRICSLPKSTPENDFLFSEEEKGKAFETNRFGKQEYECFGTCYCDISNRRSGFSTKSIKTGISYILTAVSSVIAYNLAKVHFEEKCLENLSHSCQSDHIKSQIVKCEDISVGDSDKESTLNEKRTYFCYGNCVDSKKLKYAEALKLQEDMNCEGLKMEGKVTVDESGFVLRSKKINICDKFQITAKKKFIVENLTDFCRKSSLISYQYEHFQTWAGKKYPLRQSAQTHACVGNVVYGNSLGHVRCRLIYPEPTSRNSKYWDERWWREKEEWESS